jgi:hypothetical protein
MATRGRTAYKGVAQPRSSSATSPNKDVCSSGLSRQIGEHKWWAGVAYLEQQPDMKEITVAEHWTGWRYVLARTKSSTIFVKLTFYNDKMWAIEMLSAIPNDYLTPISYFGSAPLNCGASVLGAWQTPSAPLVRCASC